MNLQPAFKTFENLPEHKKDRIKAAALSEFGSRGYAAASINTIVREAGIAKGSIFQYFGDKEGLFLFVLTSCVDMVKEYLRDVRDSTTRKDIFFRLRQTLLSGVRFIEEFPDAYRLYCQMIIDTSVPKRSEILLLLRRYSHEYILSLLESAIKKKEVHENLNPETAAFLIEAVMDRFLQAKTISHLDAGIGIFEAETETLEKWINELIEIISGGIKR